MRQTPHQFCSDAVVMNERLSKCHQIYHVPICVEAYSFVSRSDVLMNIHDEPFKACDMKWCIRKPPSAPWSDTRTNLPCVMEWGREYNRCKY